MHEGDRVRWYTLDMGSEVDLYTPHWHGNVLTTGGIHVDVISLLPGDMVTADMTPEPRHLALPLPRRRPHHRRHADPLPGPRVALV